MSRAAIDLTGRKFGLLTAISKAGRLKSATLWRCLCACGTYCTVRVDNLTCGRRTCCGCRAPAGRWTKTLCDCGRKATTFSHGTPVCQRCRDAESELHHYVRHQVPAAPAAPTEDRERHRFQDNKPIAGVGESLLVLNAMLAVAAT